MVSRMTPATAKAQRDLNLIYNPYVGHEGGGQVFKAIPSNPKSSVSSLEGWTHNGPGDHEVLKALRVRWDDGEEKTYGHPSGHSKATTIHKSERIRRMNVGAGDWVDSIQYESTHAPSGWKVGGDDGPPHEQDVGNGVLMGFWGRAGSDIDELGAVFQSDEDQVESEESS